MTSYIQNYGFTKTFIHDNEQIRQNEIQWKGKYDGNIANINVGINDNGYQDFVSMQLTNDDLINILNIQPVQIPLEKRLINDFYKPTTLEGALIRKKSRKHRKRHTNKRRKSHRHKYYSPH
jgi:hypothetical protein